MSFDEGSDESLVVLQFTDIDEANYSQQFSNKFKTIDIEAKNPIIQIGNRLYKGEYTNNIGTYLFFEQLNIEKTTNSPKSSATETNQANTDNQNLVKSEYSGKSFKKLILNRVFIEEKKD